MRWISALFVACWWMLGHAAAQDMGWTRHPQASWRLIYGGEGKDGALAFGIEMKLEQGWHTYWRSPGDAGLPIIVATDGSANVAKTELLWPAPVRVVEDWGLQTFAYGDAVTWPFLVTPEAKGKPVTLNVSVSYNVCKELCIPYENEKASLTVTPGQAPDQADHMNVEKSTARVPQAEGMMRFVSVDYAKDALTVKVRGDTPFKSPDVFVEVEGKTGFDGHRFLKPEVKLSEEGKAAELTMAHEATIKSAVLENNTLRLTLVDGEAAVERRVLFAEVGKGELKQVTPQEALKPQEAEGKPQAPVKQEGSNLPLMLLFAFLGGLILNVMPCVLPVLSLKVLGLLRHTQAFDARVARQSFLVSAAGIVSCFLLLAGVVVALKGVGMAVGWGFHFQQPAFVAVMIALLLVFAANLFGWFEIRIPGVVGESAHKASGHTGPLGDFLSGVFATLLATPCTAPFLGTAVGFALASEASIIFLVFAVMGVGLAAPYLLIAAFPKTALLLPKPGAWMVAVKKVMGVLLLATAVWLGLVFMEQVAPEDYRREGSWQYFEPEKIPTLVAEGKVVFVDITADWCVTCKANKALVLDRDEVKALLANANVVAMKGDWTRPDEKIAAFLKAHGRFGIPFNIVFTKEKPEGEVLSEVLTVEAVKKALGN